MSSFTCKPTESSSKHYEDNQSTLKHSNINHHKLPFVSKNTEKNNEKNIIEYNNTNKRSLNVIENNKNEISDELKMPPKKKTKLQLKNINPYQNWKCKICTVAQQCLKCSIPNTNSNTNNIIIDKKIDEKEFKIPTDLRELTFLTWNVWFNEEMQILERIGAIGAEIHRLSIDVICLQEVTAFILDIIRNGAWFKNGGYKCEPESKFMSQPYFNVIITRLAFDDIPRYFPYECSQMGRYLTVIPIKINDQSILFATTHLESPVGGNDNYRAKRYTQLEQSLRILNNLANIEGKYVIFGGDFNWLEPTKNKENDGSMKRFLNVKKIRGSSLLNSEPVWIDCWSKLRPNENGYTYDLKVNEMMYGWYRNRLDRVLFRALKQKGKNLLKLNSIEMIGDQPIGNLTHKKAVKKKNGEVIKILKILPSDHFGLFVKFEII